MAISFDTIPGPGTLRQPGVYSEVDNSQAITGPQAIQFRRLALGQMLATGTAEPLTLIRVTSPTQGDTLFGRGSMLAGMIRAALTQDSYTELQVMALEDDAAAAAATGTIVFGGAATAAGAINLLIAGRRVRVGVASGATPATVAASVAAAINAVPTNPDMDLPVTATVLTSTVTITARNKGEAGNGIDIRLNYYTGEETAPGITVVVTEMSGGVANPDISDAMAAIGDAWLQTWAMPYTDTANLVVLEGELSSRFQWDREIEAHAFAAFDGTQGQLSVLGDSRNSPHLDIVMATAEPMPAYEKAAESMAIAAYYLAIDPARPLQTLEYKWCLPAAEGDRLTNAERNLLLFDGIATTYVDAGGIMRTERMITTYRTSANGASDASYLDVETLFTLMYIRHDWRDYVKRKYPRHKLANDGTRYGEGQAVVTPKVMKAEAVVKAREWEELALVENIDAFKASLISERNVSDPNRLDMLLPPDLVNALRIVANKIQFRL
jgi:phage tail sheath gpL-like